MLSTAVLVAVLVGLLIATVILWAWFLRLGLRWAKVQNVTGRRVVVTTVTALILQVAINVAFLFVSPPTDGQTIMLGLVEFAITVAVTCVVIRAAFKSNTRQALQAWLATLLANVITVAIAFLVVRPFLYESFVVPTNAMAPTLLGYHWKELCPECGEPKYCSPRHQGYHTTDPLLMICENFHVTEAAEIDQSVHPSDEFMVAKFLAARRWDLVVFQFRWTLKFCM